MGSNFGFSSTPHGKVENDILSKSHKISPKRSVAVLVDLIWVAVMLTTSFVVWFLKRTRGQHYLATKKLEPKTERFVSGDFMRFWEILWDSVKCHFQLFHDEQKKSKIWTNWILTGNIIRVIWLVHMCGMTYWCKTHDPFVGMTWLIHTTDMTHSYVWRDSFIRETWLIHMCVVSVTWLTDARDMSYLYERHVSFMCVTWLIHTCDVTDSYERHNP